MFLIWNNEQDYEDNRTEILDIQNRDPKHSTEVIIGACGGIVLASADTIEFWSDNKASSWEEFFKNNLHHSHCLMIWEADRVTPNGPHIRRILGPQPWISEVPTSSIQNNYDWLVNYIKAQQNYPSVHGRDYPFREEFFKENQAQEEILRAELTRRGTHQQVEKANGSEDSLLRHD